MTRVAIVSLILNLVMIVALEVSDSQLRKLKERMSEIEKRLDTAACADATLREVFDGIKEITRETRK